VHLIATLHLTKSPGSWGDNRAFDNQESWRKAYCRGSGQWSKIVLVVRRHQHSICLQWIMFMASNSLLISKELEPVSLIAETDLIAPNLLHFVQSCLINCALWSPMINHSDIYLGGREALQAYWIRQGHRLYEFFGCEEWVRDRYDITVVHTKQYSLTFHLSTLPSCVTSKTMRQYSKDHPTVRLREPTKMEKSASDCLIEGPFGIKTKL
jgi:hypothetical protein